MKYIPKGESKIYDTNFEDDILSTEWKDAELDIKTLEKLLWSEIGTKQDYENEYGSKPLGEFVREIVGLDMNAAKEAFSEYLSDTSQLKSLEGAIK